MDGVVEVAELDMHRHPAEVVELEEVVSQEIWYQTPEPPKAEVVAVVRTMVNPVHKVYQAVMAAAVVATADGRVVQEIGA